MGEYANGIRGRGMVKVNWPVLHDRATVSSLQRSVHAPPSTAPRDYLDIHLISCYQHNRELFPDTSDVMRHPARLFNSLQHAQRVNNCSRSRTPQPQDITYGGLRDRLSVHSVKLGIGANHIAQTNRGFSRKPDGTFYSV